MARNAPHPDEVLYGKVDSRIARRFLEQLAPYKGITLLTVALMAVTALSDLALPYLFGLAIDVVDPGSDQTVFGRSGLDALNLLGIAFIVITSIRFATYGRQLFYTSQIGQWLVYDLREKMFKHLQRTGIRFVDTRGVGRIMSRLQNDVSVIDVENDVVVRSIPVGQQPWGVAVSPN